MPRRDRVGHFPGNLFPLPSLIVPPPWVAGACSASPRRRNRGRAFMSEANNTLEALSDLYGTDFSILSPPSQSQRTGHQRVVNEDFFSLLFLLLASLSLRLHGPRPSPVASLHPHLLRPRFSCSYPLVLSCCILFYFALLLFFFSFVFSFSTLFSYPSRPSLPRSSLNALWNCFQ